MPDPISWILIVICLFGSFFFSASETAIACCNRYKMQVLAEEGNNRAKTVLKIIDKFDRALTAVLIGNNVVAIAISSISTILFLKYFSAIGLDQYASLASSLIMTFVVYVFGDTLPKTIAKAIPDTMSLAGSYLILGLMYFLYPITIVFEGISKGIAKLFHIEEKHDLSEEELEKAIEKASDDLMIEENQAAIVQSTLDFKEIKVKDVLTPRENIFALDIVGLTHKKLHEILVETNYSRIPIYERNFDNIIGILHVKIYFEEYQKNNAVSIRKVLRPVYFIGEDILIDDLFKGFKKNKTHLAIVRDNTKKVLGMVTMQDVLEEIVNDISEPNNIKLKEAK